MYFDKVDEGEQIIVQRGKDKSYVLSPVSEDDLYFNPQMIDKLKQSLLEVDRGETKTIKSSEEIRDLLGL